MNFIEQMLNDEEIINKYEKSRQMFIVAPSDHGMKHIYNLMKLTQPFYDIFNLTERQKLIISVSLVLHDIGTAYGRQGHQFKSRVFAEEYLKNKGIFSEEELEEIYSVIETHDEYQDFGQLKYDTSWFVNLIDKLDFNKDRLQDNYQERFDYIVYSDIEKLEFSLDGSTFKVTIRTIENPKLISEETLFEKNLFNKAIKVLIAFCDHFSLEPEVYLEAQKLNLNKLNFDVMAGN